MDSDSELLRRYAEEGSEEAFGELVGRRVGLVYGSARRQLGDSHRAEEVVQVVFTDLARKAPELVRRPVLASWLYTATHYAVANLIRKERRQRIREHEAHLMQDINSDGSQHADWDRMRPVLDRELHGMDGGDRDAVLLRYFEDKSFAEIGNCLSLSEDAARKRVARALERLRVRLGGRGVTSTAAALSAILTEQAAIAAPEGLAGLVTKVALVQSAGAATAASGILSLMSTSKTAIGLGALLMFISLGSAVYEGRRVRAADSEFASMQGQYADNAKRLGAMEARVTAAEKAAADLGKKSQSVNPAQGAGRLSGSAGAASSSASKARATGEAFMARHPEVRDALLAYADAGHHARYAALYSSLGLTADQAHQMDVILRLQGGDFGRMLQSGMATFSAAPDYAGGATYDLPSQLKSLLGDAGYQQYQAYTQTLMARDAASGLSTLLVTSGDPLSAAQAQQLIPIFAAAGDKMTGQFDWNSIYANAQGVLSAPQMEMLRNQGTAAQGWHQVLSPAH